MKTINLQVESLTSTSADKLELNFSDFELGVGLKFQYRIFNSENFPFDGGNVYLGGEDFQNWPAAPLGEESNFDEEYIVTKILAQLNLQQKETIVEN